MPKPKQTSEIDDLFKLPLAEFTAARNALAVRLKKDGRTADAERVKSMAKPSATAWAVNQLFWRERDDLERLLTLGEKVREAQTGKAADQRALLDKRRTLISQLTMRGAEILQEAGHAASMDATRRMGITLESLSTWGRANVDEMAGRLTTDLEAVGFDGLAALLDGRKLEPAKVLQFRQATREKQTAEDAATTRARAKEEVQEAEKALTAARREAERAETALAKANARAEVLEKQKHEIEARCRTAQEEARDAAREAKKTAHSVAEAARALDRARAALS